MKNLFGFTCEHVAMIKVKHPSFTPTQVSSWCCLFDRFHTQSLLMHWIARGCTKGVLMMTMTYKIYIGLEFFFLFLDTIDTL